MFDGLSYEVVLLVVTILLTIVLVLVGRLFGKFLFAQYAKLDPSAYDSYITKETCDYKTPNPVCVPKTEEEIAAEIISQAEADGRSMGTIMSVFGSVIIIALSGWSMYKKINA